MRILLLGEYSNVHNTLSCALRLLGHEVTLASNGDFWKNYPRDINLHRKTGKLGGLALLAKVCRLLPKWQNYDIVQLINPMFLELKAERIMPIYRYLRRHNKRMVLCAMGMDYYWVNECSTRMPLKYSDFNIGKQLRTDENALKEQRDWLNTAKERLNKHIAADCDAIVSGLYEYHVCYTANFAEKTHFIPFPINTTAQEADSKPQQTASGPLKLFIGISRGRNEYKGTDIMLRAAKDMLAKYPDRLQLNIAEGLPFNDYQALMNGSDLIMDQLYSYTPAMNALLAMSKGIVCIGGGEPENYEILNESELRPIVNVSPNYDSVCDELEKLILHPERLTDMKRQSIAYIRKHHDYIKVAKQYEQLYRQLLDRQC